MDPLLRTKRQRTEQIPRCICERKSSHLSIGSACSGWCSELFAAVKLRLKFQACFACEKCSIIAELNHSLWSHHLYFEDMMSQDFMSLSPTVDLFLAGTPCQGYSAQGLGLGIDDPRGLLFYQALLWIKSRAPKTWILEQVLGLVEQHPDVMLSAIEELQAMKDDLGRQLYSIKWSVLNPRLHGGVPQNRERIFIVGIRRDVKKAEMKWPGEMKMRNITDFLEPHVPKTQLTSGTEIKNLAKAREHILGQGLNPDKDPCIVNLGGSNVHWNLGYSPCLTRSRAGSGGFYFTWLRRKMTINEILALQGVRMGACQQETVTPRQLCQIAGNAICVDVLARLMRCLLEATNLNH